MKTIICLIFYLGSLCYANEIVVLSSIADLSGRLERGITNTFLSSFKNSDYKIKIIHNSSAATLEKYLTSNKTRALFYITHGSGKSTQRGINFKSEIPNISGIDIAPILQKTNSRIKYLALVGCSSAQTINAMKSKGYLRQTKVTSFDGMITLHRSIKKAIKQGAELYDSSPQTFMVSRHFGKSRKQRPRVIGKKEFLQVKPEIKTQKDSIKIEVINDSGLEAVMTVNKHFIGVLKRSSDVQEFKIPKHLKSYGQYKMIVTYSKNEIENISPLDIRSDNMTITSKVTGVGQINGGHKSFYYLKD